MKFLKDLFGKVDENGIYKDININIINIKNEFGNCGDLTVNMSKFDKGVKYASLYIDNLIDKKSINSIAIVISEMQKEMGNIHSAEGYFSALLNSLSSTEKTAESANFDTLCSDLLSGKTIFLVDGCSKSFSVDTFAPQGRPVEEASSQSSVKGPKEGFTEQIDVNIALIRKRIKSKALRIDNFTLGNVTNTKISLIYIDKIAKETIINEIKRRLNKIQIDAILDIGYIEELIKDDRYSIFPAFLSSEKPDSVTASLLEGKVAIMVDGTPYVLLAPAFFVDFLQASEDYYHSFIISSLVRTLRYISLFLTMFVPALYIALSTFNQAMIPTQFLISIAAQHEGIPFPALSEALVMEVIFEILREAGIRMPRIIGPAISIVGALVLGQAAVEAGIISAVVVITVSITAISSFAIPNYSMANAIRVVRFLLMIFASVFGLYGIFMASFALLLHLCKLKSIGIPYMTPFVSNRKSEFKDAVFRFPLWNNKFRPSVLSGENNQRVRNENIITDEQKENPEYR